MFMHRPLLFPSDGKRPIAATASAASGAFPLGKHLRTLALRGRLLFNGPSELEVGERGNRSGRDFPHSLSIYRCLSEWKRKNRRCVYGGEGRAARRDEGGRFAQSASASAKFIKERLRGARIPANLPLTENARCCILKVQYPINLVF